MLLVDPPATAPDLEARILQVIGSLGRAGITRDELLRKLGVSYDALMAALASLEARGMVHVLWPEPESFRVTAVV